MNKYLYKIKDLEIPTHLKYWFLRKSKINFDLSRILNGTNFDLENSVNKKLHLINIFGNSVQNGEATPESPIEIKSTGDNGYIIEKFVNKNLFDFDRLKRDNNSQIIYNGDAQNFSVKSSYTMNIYADFKENTRYKISGNWSGAENNGNGEMRILYTDGTNSYINGAYDGHAFNYNLNINSASNKTIQSIEIQNWGYKTFNFKNLSITEGITNQSYVVHQEQVYTIPCQKPMRSIGDVKDTFVKVNGVWYERHKIGKYAFNGNENFFINNNLSNENYKIFYMYYNSMVNNSKLICNRFIYGNNRGNGNCIIAPYLKELDISIDASIASNIKELKTFLQNNQTYMLYELITSTDLPCTQAQITALESLQKARTYKNITHIYSEDEVPADLEIQYYKEKER